MSSLAASLLHLSLDLCLVCSDAGGVAWLADLPQLRTLRLNVLLCTGEPQRSRSTASDSSGGSSHMSGEEPKLRRPRG